MKVSGIMGFFFRSKKILVCFSIVGSLALVVLYLGILSPKITKADSLQPSSIKVIDFLPPMPWITSADISACEHVNDGFYLVSDLRPERCEAYSHFLKSYLLLSQNTPGSIYKQVNTSLVPPGGTLCYTLTVGNNAATPITYTVIDTIPMYGTYVNGSASHNLNFSATKNQLTTTVRLTGTHLDIQADPFITPYISLADLGVSPYPCPDSDCHHASMLLGEMNFTYNGEKVRSVLWHSDGFLGINSVKTFTQTVNQNLPDAAEPNNVIAPLWMDYDLDGGNGDLTGGGHLYYARVNDGVYDYTVFEWNQVQLFNEPATSYSFQVWFREGTNDLWFVYDVLSGTLQTATVGIENYSGFAGKTIYYNQIGYPPIKGDSFKIINPADMAVYNFCIHAAFIGGKTIRNVARLRNSQGEDSITDSVYSITTITFRQFLPLIQR